MKTLSTLLVVFIIGISSIIAQPTSNQSAINTGYAPPFKAKSTQGDIKFPDDYYGKWKIIFSHPADFTPVCTSEIMELARMQDEFKKLNTALLVISTDGLNSHIEWVKSIESIIMDGHAPVKIDFPILSDVDMTISNKYGIIQQKAGKSYDRRSVFIINEENKIMAVFYYPDQVGRNIDEIMRTLVALQTTEKHNVYTPANWTVGNDVLIPSPATVDESKKLDDQKKSDIYNVAWYMWFKRL